MKKDPPIKRHEALISFSKDHHFGLLLVWKIRQGLKMDVAPERISNYAIFFFETDLREHFEKEEETLFSKLEPNDTLRKQAYREHTQIQSLVGQISQNKSDTVILEKFAETLESHIRFEERILFNHLQNILSEEELIKGAKEHGKHHGNPDDKWSDHFWISK
jgi:hemerythrin-like domain-containing protein